MGGERRHNGRPRVRYRRRMRRPGSSGSGASPCHPGRRPHGRHPVGSNGKQCLHRDSGRRGGQLYGHLRLHGQSGQRLDRKHHIIDPPPGRPPCGIHASAGLLGRVGRSPRLPILQGFSSLARHEEEGDIDGIAAPDHGLHSPPHQVEREFAQGSAHHFLHAFSLNHGVRTSRSLGR